MSRSEHDYDELERIYNWQIIQRISFNLITLVSFYWLARFQSERGRCLFYTIYTNNLGELKRSIVRTSWIANFKISFIR